MRKVVFLPFLMCFFIKVNAQYNKTIRSGRPGQAIGPFTVGKGVFQTQTGIDFYNEQFDSKKSRQNSYVPNTVLRYAISDRFEINSGLSYSFLEGGPEGLSSTTLGTRINLNKGENGWPAMGLQLSFKLPILDDAFNFNGVAPKLLFVISKSITDKLGATVNIGSNYAVETLNAKTDYVFNLSYSLNDKMGVFLEPYGSFTKESFEVKFDTGVSYLLNKDFQLDALIGYGKNNGVEELMAGAGFSWRIVTNSKKK